MKLRLPRIQNSTEKATQWIKYWMKSTASCRTWLSKPTNMWKICQECKPNRTTITGTLENNFILEFLFKFFD